MAIEIDLEQQKQAVQPDEKQRKAEALALVVDHVRRDAAKDSQQYLDETIVPHGGE